MAVEIYGSGTGNASGEPVDPGETYDGTPMSNPRHETIRQPETKTGAGDSNRVAHIVRKDQQMRGYVGGEAIQALCGKTWVPSRDYRGLPICEACVEERERRLSGMKGLN